MQMQAHPKLLSNANVEKQLNILNDTLFNIFSPWTNDGIKCKIKSKNKTSQQYLKNGRKINDFEIVDKEAAELPEMIQNQKERYFCYLSVKLNNPQTSPKMYWPIIKSCYNGRKIPIIPPLSVNGIVITDVNGKIFLTILHQMRVSYLKIKHILQKLNYHLSILKMTIYTK